MPAFINSKFSFLDYYHFLCYIFYLYIFRLNLRTDRHKAVHHL